jgi:putative transposase
VLVCGVIVFGMGLRPIQLVTGEFYHVYNRGTDKRLLFRDDTDRLRFMKLLYLSNTVRHINVRNLLRKTDDPYALDRGEPLVHIGAYSLMPNHFHILLTPCVEHGVSLFMKKLCTGYSMYFNKRYNRTGTLLEGPFKAKWVDNDIYLKYLYAYIHLNPIKLRNREDILTEPSNQELLEYLRAYHYSSLPDYLQLPRPESVIIDTVPFPEYFETMADQVGELKEWLMLREEGI